MFEGLADRPVSAESPDLRAGPIQSGSLAQLKDSVLYYMASDMVVVGGAIMQLFGDTGRAT